MSNLLGNLTNVSGLLSGNSSKNSDLENSDLEVWLDINLIDPDPEQPRKSFDEEELQNLSNSMTYVNEKTGKQRGNKQAIIVRKNPNSEGRYIIVMGERRWRAAALGGMKQIRARVDSYTDRDEIDTDQIIENIQKSDLKPKEMALWIGKKLRQGFKKNELAKMIGKSNSFITQYVALLSLPGAINELYQNDKCNDVTLLNDLSALHKKYPEELDNWIKDEKSINRNSFKLFKEYLDSKESEPEPEPNNEVNGKEYTPDKLITSEVKVTPENKNPSKLKKPIINIEHSGQPGVLIINKKPLKQGYGWVKYSEDSEALEVELKNLVIISIIDS